MELVFHPQQLGGLFLGEAVDRDAGPVGQHLGDDLLVDDVEQFDALGPPLGLHGLLGIEAVLLLLGELLRLVEGLLFDRGFLVGSESGDLLFELLVRRRGGHPADPQTAPGLVDEVDRLVRQEPVGQVAVSQVGRGHQGLVRDRHRMVRLIAVPQALEDLDGQGHIRLLHLDRLEPALERGVLLQVLAVLVDGRGTDGLQLAPGQHRLEDRGGIDGTFGGTRTHQGVELVDEQDDVAPGADLLENLLQALLEVAAVPAPGHERAQVEGIELLAGERLGDLVSDDALGQSLDDRRLTDTWLADQNRVVLGAAGQHLHDPFDLFFSPDDWVELVIACERSQVAAELVEHGRARGGVSLLIACLATTDSLFALVTREQLDDLLADLGEIGAEALQHLRCHPFALPHQAEQHVLGADVAVAKLQCLAQRQLEHLLGSGREGRRAGRGGTRQADRLLHLLPHGLEGHPQRLQCFSSDTLTLVDQAKKDVLGANETVVEQPRLLLCQHQDSSSSVCESFEHSTASIRGQKLKPKSTGARSPRIRSPGTRGACTTHRQSALSSVASERRRPLGPPHT